MSSMYHSISDALHSLRNPHFPRRLPARNTRREQKGNGCADAAFDCELHEHISQLNVSPDQGFLTLPWLHDSVKLVLLACTHISNHLPSITCSEKEKVLLEANLGDTLNLLDVCNGLKEVLHDVQYYVMLVRYAARSAMDVRDVSYEELESKFSQLRTALSKAAEFMHAKVEENGRHREGRSKLETCSSMLRRMGEPLAEASPGSRRAASNELFNKLYGAKVLAIFVCSVLAIALSVKPTRRLSCVHTTDQPPWLGLLQEVQQNVKKVTDTGIKNGKVALLKELDEVRMHTEELREKLDNVVNGGMPLAQLDKSSLSQQCEKLVNDSDRLQKGLLELQQNMDALFRMLVTIRVDFLDALCHS